MTFHKIITSAANDEMKSLARLLDNARERRKQQLLVLEGLHLLQAALDHCDGHRGEAASVLGLGRNTVTRKLGASRKRR